jgi:hypothetical protein
MQVVNGHAANGNGNGNGHGAGNGASAAFTEEKQQQPFSRPTQGKVSNVLLQMHNDLVEYGRKRAKLSLDIKPNQDDLLALQEHAEAMADEAYREAYDPAKHEDHKLREAEYQKLQADREEAELTAGYALAEVAKLETEMAKAQSNMLPPTKPQVLMVSAVAGLALTIAPTLHDYVFITMTDDITNWAVSLLSAAIYGVFITWGLLDSDDVRGRRSARNWLGLVGGIGVPVGLGLLRIANASDTAEIVFAIALTVVEVGIVILLESRSATLRVAYQEWAVQQAGGKDIVTRLEAARAKLARRKQSLAEINDSINGHINLVSELAVRNFNIDKIKADAVRAVRDGYFDGIAYNRGLTRS